MILGVLAWGVILGVITTVVIWPAAWGWRLVCLAVCSSLWAVVAGLWNARQEAKHRGYITRRNRRE